MSEIIKTLHENINRTRRSAYSEARIEDDGTLDEIKILLDNLENDPNNYLENQSELQLSEVGSAVWLARLECKILSSVWWRYYFHELPNVRRAIYRWQYPERKEKHFHPIYLGGQEMLEDMPDEVNQIPEVNDHLLWYKEARDLLGQAMTVWDMSERLYINLILNDNQPDEVELTDDEMTQRERILARVSGRLQPVIDREANKLLGELFDPSIVLERYATAYIDFKHLFHSYSTNLCVDTVWGWTTDWDLYSHKSVAPYQNIDQFIKTSMRLSETKMRLVRHAEIQPDILEQASRAKVEIDDTFQRDEDLFFNQLF